jgi:hypothetical protein
MDAVDILAPDLRPLVIDRQQLSLENLALRQQVAVLRRGVARPERDDKNRVSWIGLMPCSTLGATAPWPSGPSCLLAHDRSRITQSSTESAWFASRYRPVSWFPGAH